ncbi:hypothetical protein J1N35_007474, partial [Gossypium stocksii]
MLILEGYDVQSFVLGTVSVPTQFVVNKNGKLIKNSGYVLHVQQDKLLSSWLLSIAGDVILVYLTNAPTSYDIWPTIEKSLQLILLSNSLVFRHALFSQKKGHLSIKEYLSEIKFMSDMLITAMSSISKQKQDSIILAGLSVKHELMQ